jgi:hypothetical protein
MRQPLHARTRLLCMGVFSSCAIFFQDMLHLGILLLLVWSLIRLNPAVGFFSAMKWTLRYAVKMGIFLLTLVLFSPWEFLAGDFLRFLIILSLPHFLQGAKQRELMQAFLALRIPYEIVFMLRIAVSFYPLFWEQAKDLWYAVQLRGVALQNMTGRERWFLYLSLLMPLLGGAVRKARGLAVSLEARGLGAGKTRTEYALEPLCFFDYAVLFYTAGSCTLLLCF